MIFSKASSPLQIVPAINPFIVGRFGTLNRPARHESSQITFVNLISENRECHVKARYLSLAERRRFAANAVQSFEIHPGSL
jgi:uncharacterized membrane protein